MSESHAREREHLLIEQRKELGAHLGNRVVDEVVAYRQLLSAPDYLRHEPEQAAEVAARNRDDLVELRTALEEACAVNAPCDDDLERTYAQGICLALSATY